MDTDRKAGTSASGRAIGAGWISAGLHAAIAILIGAIVREAPIQNATSVEPKTAQPMVWLERAGTIAGGGKYGDRTREPAPPAEQRGRDRVTIPSRVTTTLVGNEDREPPVQQIDIPVMPESSGLRELPGNITAVASITGTGGPGSDRGAGDGDGPGFDRGRDGGVGGGPRGTGGNTTSPEVIRQVRPNYTSSALQARVQGLVVMDAVILKDGSVGDVKIVRSLDRTFGLDDEAIKAVKQWRFRPGRRAGDPIPMVVSVEMLFELR
jgi:protein TonB